MMMLIYSDSLNKGANVKQIENLPLSLMPALQLGISVFTTLRSEAPHCWRRAHYKRLHQNAQDLLGGMPHFREFANALDACLAEHVQSLCENNAYRLRLTLIPHHFQMGMMRKHEQNAPVSWALLVALSDEHRLEAYPNHFNDLPEITTHVAHYQSLTPSFKKGSQLDSLYLRQSLATEGEDVLWVNDEGDVTELTHASLFVHHATLGWLTPPSDQCLSGVTRQQVIKASREAGITVTQQDIHGRMLGQVDAAFATNSTQGWTRIVAFVRDGVRHDVTTALETLPEANTLYAAWHSLVTTASTSCYSTLP
jgi:branched-subunit amino acid aminotransferase/4-amino-4-deoxychorismate lyase